MIMKIMEFLFGLLVLGPVICFILMIISDIAKTFLDEG